jgi:hypothetical protein
MRAIRRFPIVVGLALSASCRVPPYPPEPYVALTAAERSALGCYAFRDPGDTTQLLMRLDSTVDRTFGDSSGVHFVARTLVVATQPRLRADRIYPQRIWYFRPRLYGDTVLFLNVGGVTEGTLFILRRRPDSLVGQALRCFDVGPCRDPRPVAGVRVPCAT